MKTFVLVSAVLVALVSVIAVAQDTSKPDENTNHQAMFRKAVTISGSVSEDGKTLVRENDKWDVSNPDALVGREGHQVTVRCHMEQDRHRIHVLSVKMAQSEVKYTANRGDSAFRR